MGQAVRTIRSAAFAFARPALVTPEPDETGWARAASEQQAAEAGQFDGVRRWRPPRKARPHGPGIGGQLPTPPRGSVAVTARRRAAEVLDQRRHSRRNDRIRLDAAATLVVCPMPEVTLDAGDATVRRCRCRPCLHRGRNQRRERGGVDAHEAVRRHERQHAPASVEPKTSDHGADPPGRHARAGLSACWIHHPRSRGPRS